MWKACALGAKPIIATTLAGGEVGLASSTVAAVSNFSSEKSSLIPVRRRSRPAAGPLCHEGPVAAAAHDQAILLKAAQGLAHGFAGHAELAAQRVLGRQPVAGQQIARQPAHEQLTNLQVFGIGCEK